MADKEYIERNAALNTILGDRRMLTIHRGMQERLKKSMPPTWWRS